MAYEDNHFIDSARMVWNYSLFTESDIKNFASGQLVNGYDKFGSHRIIINGIEGYYFAVWAPHAVDVSVIGDFNGWKQSLHRLIPRLDHSGIWEGFIPRLRKGLHYKYHIAAANGWSGEKADPYANFSQLRPETASIMWSFEKQWNDKDWMQHRGSHNSINAPWSVYEVHLASWMRPEKNNEDRYNSYLQIAERLVPYVKEMGFTHVEFMPIMEYPFDGSWGYQGAGYFSATSRFGIPEDCMHLIDMLHQNGIGVILDWVPSHFPDDAHGLYFFDGAHTYEYADRRKGYHPDWNSYIFNYARGEVVSFLLSSAHFWLDQFHIDGLRVDAVNSIIRLDFSRKEGEWEANVNGGNENLEAIRFLQKLNESIYDRFSGVQTIAEEASDWTGITAPIKNNGLGFGMKWMMGWMHDTFRYFKIHPPHRGNEQNAFTFSIMYFYDDKFMLPLSHDEVVHGKSPMIYKMPGNEWEKFANLRLLYAYMFTHPGAKLMFMGNEFGQTSEWDYGSELNWELLQFPIHENLQHCVRDLNRIYRSYPALYELQFDKKGFQWEMLDHRQESVMIFRRMGHHKDNDLIIVLNTSANNYSNWHFSVKGKKGWHEIFNSNDIKFGGSGFGLNNQIESEKSEKGRGYRSIKVDIPALSALILCQSE